MLIHLLGLLLAGQSLHTIAGHVVRHVDGQPIRGAEVMVAVTGEREKSISAVSGDEGEFRFTGIPAGKYDLIVTLHGRSQAYHETGGYATAIVTGPNWDTEHIRFEFEMPASLSGKVVDEENEPAPQVTVHLFRQNVIDGKNRIENTATFGTDTSGEFHFRNLEAGTYYVALTGMPWYSQAVLYATGQQVQKNSELEVSYPLTYYSGAMTAEGATPIHLQEAQKAHIEMSVRAVPALRVKLEGILIDGPVSGRVQGVAARGPGGLAIQVPPIFIGDEIVGLAPGNYAITFGEHTEGASLSTAVMNVTGDTTLRASDVPRTLVKGRVIFAASIGASKTQWEISASGTNGMAYQGVVGADGSFEIAGMMEGKYALGLMNSPDLYFSKVEVKGATYAQGELEVRTGAKVELAITARGGLSDLNGVAKREGKAMDGAMVLAIPQDGNQRTGRDQSDGDGTFSLKGLAPGRYALVAIDDGRGLAYTEPKVIEPYLGGAKVVDLPAKEKGEVVEVEVQRRVREE